MHEKPAGLDRVRRTRGRATQSAFLDFKEAFNLSPRGKVMLTVAKLSVLTNMLNNLAAIQS